MQACQTGTKTIKSGTIFAQLTKYVQMVLCMKCEEFPDNFKLPRQNNDIFMGISDCLKALDKFFDSLLNTCISKKKGQLNKCEGVALY